MHTVRFRDWIWSIDGRGTVLASRDGDCRLICHVSASDMSGYDPESILDGILADEPNPDTYPPRKENHDN